MTIDQTPVPFQLYLVGLSPESSRIQLLKYNAIGRHGNGPRAENFMDKLNQRTTVGMWN